MKTSEILMEVANRYEAWGNFEKCICPDKMYHVAYVFDQLSKAFEKYENGEQLPQYYEEDNTNELRLIAEIVFHSQQII